MQVRDVGAVAEEAAAADSQLVGLCGQRFAQQTVADDEQLEPRPARLQPRERGQQHVEPLDLLEPADGADRDVRRFEAERAPRRRDFPRIRRKCIGSIPLRSVVIRSAFTPI